jgi:NPCBM/NEW2 domain
VWNLAVLFALISTAPVAAEKTTATRLDGMAIVGELRSWDETRVVMTAGGAEQTILLNDLLSLRWASMRPGDEPSATFDSAEMELIDGSRIPIDEFQSTATQATVGLAPWRTSLEKTLQLARKQLVAVRLQPLSASAAQQWGEIRDIHFTSDVLVLLKRKGQSLDYVEGVLGDVSAEKIEFKLEGESLRIDRAKVAGLIFYRAKDRADGEPRCVVRGNSGLQAVVSKAQLVNGIVELTTVNGVALDWPLQDIYLADYSAGKLVYLSDIEPVTEQWTPLVGLPAGATLAAEYGRPRSDRSAYGGPLTLRLEDSTSRSAAEQTGTFNKGLALRSRTELVFRLPSSFGRFTTIAGIDPSTSTSGNVRLEIHGDDRLLFEDAIGGGEPPRSIDLDISGVKRLKLIVDYGSNLDSGDWLNLCDARIVK